MKLTKSTANKMIDCLYDHILEESKNFIASSKSYNENSFIDAIDHYLEPEPKKDTISELFKEYIYSLQNSNMMPYVINLAKIDPKFLLNFNCHKIIDTYGNNVSKFLKAVKHYNPGISPFGKELWKRFAGGVLDGAKLFIQFKSLKDFEKYLKPFRARKAEGAILLAESLGSGHLRGLRFALAMDFLKNSGTSISKYCVKPDVHLLETIPYLHIFKNGYKKSGLNDAIVRFVDKISDFTGYSSFEIDKLIWLSNSGFFYDHDDIGRLWPSNKISRIRKRLIKRINYETGN
jgi:hypothetical protein